MFQFVKGRTYQHLSWIMPDATDFASPESALSAAMKIKIWGKLRGSTGVNFVTSGTGSLTNDIVHVGPSVLGLYTIALAKADLSDASAAWYDQYIISLSATGAAYQTLIADGGIDLSAISAYQSRLSDLYSLLSDLQSDFQSRVPKRVATDSQLSDVSSDLRSLITAGVGLTTSAMSDVASQVWAHTIGTRVDSRILVAQSFLSDIRSSVSDLSSDLLSVITTTGVQLNASSLSDIRSAITANTPTLSASDISDIASAVTAAFTLSTSAMSDIASQVWAHAIGARVDSRLLVAQSYLSDIRSHVSDLQSDFQSRVPKLVATNSQLSDLASDIKSAVGGITATLSASDLSDIRSAIAAAQSDLRSLISTTGPTISDIGSAVWADPAALLVSSRVSDLQSKLSDVESNLLSLLTTTGVQLNASSLSDLRSAITAVTASVSASDMSDIASRVDVLLASRLSDILSAAQQTNSRVLVIQSMASDTYSQLSDFRSDLHSFVSTTGVQLNASTLSDIRSAVAGVTVSLDASAISDIASAVLAGAGTTTLSASDMSDIASRVWAEAAAAALTSRVLVIKSAASDTYSLLSDLQSDFQSRVPKRVATDSQLSDLASDLKSTLAAGVPVSASDMSDLRSAITAGGISASGISDIVSAVQVAIDSRLSDILSAAQQTNSRALVLQSNLSDVQSAVAALPSVGAIADAVFDEPIAGHTTAGSYGDKLGAHLPAVLKGLTTSGSTTTTIVLNATTGIDGAAPSSTNDFFNGRVVIFTSGALAGQATSITDYDGATKTLTVVALTNAPASGVTFVIV